MDQNFTLNTYEIYRNQHEIVKFSFWQKPFVDENGQTVIDKDIRNYIIEKMDIYLGLNRKFINIKDERYDLSDHEEHRYEASSIT